MLELEDGIPAALGIRRFFLCTFEDKHLQSILIHRNTISCVVYLVDMLEQ
jgi:hypothetical protein